MTPPKGAGGFGRYLPSTVVVALGEHGVPEVCWPLADVVENRNRKKTIASGVRLRKRRAAFVPTTMSSKGTNKAEKTKTSSHLQSDIFLIMSVPWACET